jgi:hypothetical protein
MTRYVNGRALPTGMFAASYDSAPPPVTPAQPVNSLAPKKSAGDVQTTAPTINQTINASVAAPKTPYVAIGNPHMDPISDTPSVSVGLPDRRGRNAAGPAKFPADLEAMQPTWMEIWSYKRTGVAIGSRHADSDFTLKSVGPTTHVCLPIPSGVGTGYGHSWDQSDISMADEFALHERRLGGLIAGATDSRRPEEKKTDRAKDAAIANVGTMDSIKGMFSGLEGSAIAKTIGLKSAGDLLGGGTQQATGKAAFNEQVVHYSGPQFRTFEFSFSLKPMSASDQSNIQKIIYFLKVGSQPDLKASGGIGRVYELPLFFKIKFMGSRGELTHMNRIAFCALTGFNVKYGGDRFQTFSANNAPVQTDISMSFKEISLLNKAAVQQGY